MPVLPGCALAECLAPSMSPTFQHSQVGAGTTWDTKPLAL